VNFNPESTLAKVIRFYEAGGPEVLRIEDQPVADPGEGEVRVRHVAVGLNFADTYFRQGYYPVPLPNGMGVEASGVIEAVGSNVNGYQVGDRVTYTGSPLGAYSTERVMPIGSLIKLPVDIDHQTAAAMTMRGLSAAYWLLKTNPWMKKRRHDPYPCGGGRRRLDRHSGQAPWPARHRYRLLDPQGRDREGPRLDEIIFYHSEDVATRIRELTDGVGVRPYSTLSAGHVRRVAQVLKRRGVLVGCGTASGPSPDRRTEARDAGLGLSPALRSPITSPIRPSAPNTGALFDHVAGGRINWINQRYGSWRMPCGRTGTSRQARRPAPRSS
jgi:NADPH2:quinone reductase